MQKKVYAFLAEHIPTWLNKRHEKAVRQNIIEGCREMWDINVEIEREFHPLEEEVARANPPE